MINQFKKHLESLKSCSEGYESDMMLSKQTCNEQRRGLAGRKRRLAAVLVLLLLGTVLSASGCGKQPANQDAQSKDVPSAAEVTDQAEASAQSEASSQEAASSQAETSSQPALAPADDAFIEKYGSDIVLVAVLALDDYIREYSLSLSPDKWTLAKFDDKDTVIGITDISYKNIDGKYMYVGTLHFDETGTVIGAASHYLEVNEIVLGNDGYCDEVFGKLNGAVSAE